MPIPGWARDDQRDTSASDIRAAVIVTIMPIPQSLAYALPAGLPPVARLCAFIVPILLYTVFGTSRVLAVGPLAVVPLRTAATIGQVAEAGTAGYALAALMLAFLSDGMLRLMGVFRLNDTDLSALGTPDTGPPAARHRGQATPVRGEGAGDGPAAPQHLLPHLAGKVFVSQVEAFCKPTGRSASGPPEPHAKA